MLLLLSEDKSGPEYECYPRAKEHVMNHDISEALTSVFLSLMNKKTIVFTSIFLACMLCFAWILSRGSPAHTTSENDVYNESSAYNEYVTQPVAQEVTTTVTIAPVVANAPSVVIPENNSPEVESVDDVEVEKKITATVRVRPPNGSTAVYSVKVVDNSTVYDVMIAAKESGLRFKEKKFPGIGVYITTMNGVEEEARAGMYWTLYVNGNFSSVGVSDARIHDGDVITWKFERK